MCVCVCVGWGRRLTIFKNCIQLQLVNLITFVFQSNYCSDLSHEEIVQYPINCRFLPKMMSSKPSKQLLTSVVLCVSQ